MCSNILCERVPFACVLWLWRANTFWCGSELPQKTVCNANDKIKPTRPFITSCCCRSHHHRSRHVSRGIKVRACKAGPIRSGRIVPGLKTRFWRPEMLKVGDAQRQSSVTCHSGAAPDRHSVLSCQYSSWHSVWLHPAGCACLRADCELWHQCVCHQTHWCHCHADLACRLATRTARAACARRAHRSTSYMCICCWVNTTARYTWCVEHKQALTVVVSVAHHDIGCAQVRARLRACRSELFRVLAERPEE